MGTLGAMRSLLVALAFGCSSSAPVTRPPQPQAPPVDAAVAIVPVVTIDAAPPPVAVVSKVVDLAALPEWPMPPGAKATARPLAIAAADANLDALLVALVPKGLPVVARTTGTRVTGRIAAPSREAAYDAVAALAPDPAAFTTRVPLAGKSQSVTLQFSAAPMFDLLRFLAAVLENNIVIAPGELPRLDVVVNRTPADAVLERIATVTGFDIHRAGKTLFLMPHGTAAPIPTHPKGKLVSIDANDANASDVLRAITALAPLDVRVACDTGAKVHLRIRRVPLELAAYAIAFASGLALERGAPACPMEPTPNEAPPMTARLAVIADAGTARVALFEDHERRWLFKPAPKIEIGESWAVFTLNDTERREFGLHPVEPGVLGVPWLEGDWRLTATLTGDAPAAIVDLPDGTWHTISQSWQPDATLVIEPDHLVITLATGFRSERHLERR